MAWVLSEWLGQSLVVFHLPDGCGRGGGRGRVLVLGRTLTEVKSLVGQHAGARGSRLLPILFLENLNKKEKNVEQR